MKATAQKLKPQHADKHCLHVGCGPQSTQMLPAVFKSHPWKEIRLDIDARVEPDIVASITDMAQVETGSMDAVYSSHNIEHLMLHEVKLALKEFFRVLKPDGFVFLTCPDLQAVAALVAEGKLFESAYMSQAGAITPFDMIFGYSEYTRSNSFMAHKSGFTMSGLAQLFMQAGFIMPAGFRKPERFEMWMLAYKTKQDEAFVKESFMQLTKFDSRLTQ